MEILHTMHLASIEIPFENIKVNEIEKRNSFEHQTPTKTFPFLETKEGNISQSDAIIYYLCQKYKPELLGQNIFEKAKIMQWVEFSNCEINQCNRNIIYPIFGWEELNKEDYNRDNNKIKEYLKNIEKELEKNEYIIGNKLTLVNSSSVTKQIISYKLFSIKNKKYEKSIINLDGSPADSISPCLCTTKKNGSKAYNYCC